MLTVRDFLAGLGFVLAVDNCARGCAHCPAYGSRAPVTRAPMNRLDATLGELTEAMALHGLATPTRVVHCWRISDPLDYWCRLPGGGLATCADVAGLWRTHLGQGLYVVTNGSKGRRPGRRALAAIAAAPELVSQVKLTVTPFDRSWGTPNYLEDLAHDLRTLAGLWDLRAVRAEDPNGRRLRINAKTTSEKTGQVREFLIELLRRAGWSLHSANAVCDNPEMVRFKPVYDLGSAVGASPIPTAVNICDATGARHKPTADTRTRSQYGIRPDGRLFEVDMYAFVERDLRDRSGDPLNWRSPSRIDGPVEGLADG